MGQKCSPLCGEVKIKALDESAVAQEVTDAK